jgi:hypothetical protein
MTYTLTSKTTIIRDLDNAFIPVDPANTDYQAYQVWLAEGNTPNPYVPPPEPTPNLTFLQFMALFTASEQAAIVNSADLQIKLFTLMAAGAGSIQLNNAEVTTGVNYLVTAGILTSDREKAVLSNTPPSQ